MKFMDLDKYSLDRFKAGLLEFDLDFDDFKLMQLMQYYELLIEWNSFMNLTAVTEFEEVCTKHFLDSLSLCRAINCNRELSLVDIGTGAGFPGIPLKIAFPDMKITLLDSLGKRVKFLDEVIKRLDLKGIDTVHGRAEDFAKPGMLRESFDVCVSRAVANLSTLLEYCIPYVKLGGCFVSYKSEKTAKEMSAAGKAVNILGGEAGGCIEFVLPGSDIYRNLIVIKKVKVTPEKYPRRAGLPLKEPL